MKIRYPGRIVLLLSLLLSILPAAGRDKVKDGIYKIEIYATNDVHGRIFDSTYTSDVSNGYSLTKVSTYIKQARARVGENSVVLLDVGDGLQGDNSVFYYNSVDTISDHLLCKVANYIKYDAMVVGNHDIETGHRVYDKINKCLKAPYLAANAIDVKTGKSYFQPYTILNKNGIKIAVIGMTNPNIKKWLSRELWYGIDFKEIAPIMEKMIDKIRKKENPHLIIAAVHSGLGDEDVDQIENSAKFIAKHINGIDAVFAAHDHKSFADYIINGKDSVPVMEAASKAQYLSFADVRLVIKNGKVISKSLKPSLISMNQVSPDSLFIKQFHNEYIAVKNFTNEPVGRLINKISIRDAFFGPSSYLGLIHSLQLQESGADISFAAPLSFNTTINAGELDYQDLLNIYPFENQLYLIEMTGREIKDYLEFSYSKWVNQMKDKTDHLICIVDRKGSDTTNKDERQILSNQYYNFDSAAGIIYEVDVRKGIGERIKIISMENGDPFLYEKKYKVALTSYRANGGGDLLEKGANIPYEELENRVLERYSDIRDLLFKMLKREKEINPTCPDNWKFVPEEYVKEAVVRDYNLLFNNR